MPIEDLTCDKCIYSAQDPCSAYSEDRNTIACRRRATETRIIPITYWCGEGEWPVVVKGEHWITHIKLAKRRDLYCTPDLTYEWPEDHREA